MKYENPCSQCGICCLMEICPNAKALGIKSQETPCRFLMITKDSKTACGLFVFCLALYPEGGPDHIEHMNELFGINKGCCISGKAGKEENGQMVLRDIASLPTEEKTKLAAQLMTAKREEVFNAISNN